MFDNEFAAKAAQLHTLAAELAAHITTDTTGTLAVKVLPELFAAVRQGELACVRLIERADRTGEYATGGAASISAYVRATANESAGWATKRVHLGRALADQLPATAAGWQQGDLGLEHAHVIDQATTTVDDDELLASLDAYLAMLASAMTPKSWPPPRPT